PELDVPGARCDEKCEEDPACPRVRRRPRIRDHEEREEQERAVFKAMNRDRQWFTEPDRSTEDKRHVERDERVGHIASARAVDDEAAETRHEEREKRDVAPLAR